MNTENFNLNGSSASPSSRSLCTKGCGFYGSSATMNMCSGCYKKYLIEQENSFDDQTKSSSTPHPCVKGCGFFGSSATMDMCSSCYLNFIIEQKVIGTEPLISLKMPSSSSSSLAGPATTKGISSASDCERVAIKNRCENCNKKVGLIGFKCRCEKTFCGLNRYPEEHSCKFDYKKAGIENIIKQNPLIKADKLDERI